MSSKQYSDRVSTLLQRRVGITLAQLCAVSVEATDDVSNFWRGGWRSRDAAKELVIQHQPSVTLAVIRAGGVA